MIFDYAQAFWKRLESASPLLQETMRLISNAVNLILMPIAGNYLDALFHRGRGLRVPYDGLFFLSLFLIAVTLIFTAKAGRRAEKSPLEDILHE